MTVVLLLCRCCLFLFRMYRGYRATTVGIRYGVARKQFSMRPHVPDGGLGSGPSEDESKAGVETSILDYPLYQRRIVPLLSQAYALYFTGKFMIKLYSQFQSVRCDGQRQCYNEGVSMLRLCWQNLNKSNDFSLREARVSIDRGLPVVVWRRFSSERNRIHSLQTLQATRNPGFRIPPPDTATRETWPDEQAPLHASVVVGYNAEHREILFLESWAGMDAPRRMHAEELAATAYLTFYFKQ